MKIRSMNLLNREIFPQISNILKRDKSVLLLGARQTGKTTLVSESLNPDITYSFAHLETKYRYLKDPVQFEKDLTYQLQQMGQCPLVFIDEIQKVPAVMDAVQYIIDKRQAQFILSGSSARKLKHGSAINLLPGRVISVSMDPLSVNELPKLLRQDLVTLLTDGSLPGVLLASTDIREQELATYVMTYIEEEIRQEALVRNVGAFSQFLELAAIESGNAINFTRIAQDIGVSDQTLKEYFQILEDCLIVFKIPAISETTSRRILLKAPKYLFFDLGVRRLAAGEGRRASVKTLAQWFEQFVGLELIRAIHIYQPTYKLQYWRDTNGIEVDYVLDTGDDYIPVEVKWSEAPREKDARHLTKFIADYENCTKGYIICRTPTPYQVSPNIVALPWQQIQHIAVPPLTR